MCCVSVKGIRNTQVQTTLHAGVPGTPEEEGMDKGHRKPGGEGDWNPLVLETQRMSREWQMSGPERRQKA